MANGLFIPDFRGPGTPGAGAPGSTRRGLALADIARSGAQTSQAGVQGSRDTARINSIVQGAQQLKLISDPDAKLAFLNQRKQQLEESGLPANDTDEAIALLQAGDLSGLEEVTDQAIDLGRRFSTQGKELFSATTTTLPDGTTIQTTNQGRKIVTDAAGKVLSGKDAIEAIITSEKFKTEEQIKRAGGKKKAGLEAELELKPEVEATTKAAKDAIGQSTKIFERLEPLQQNLVNIDEAIRLIDEGAKTGVIASRLPSIRSSSIELDTLQKRLGLDVIAGATFGALSEGEREFALSTALPKNLKGPDLKRWLQRKKQAQEKLIAQLQEASIFLGTPGNTIADFIELKKLETLDRSEGANQGEAAATDDIDLSTLTLEQLIQMREQQL